MPTPQQIAFCKAIRQSDEVAALLALEGITELDSLSFRTKENHIYCPIHLIAENGLARVLAKILEKGFLDAVCKRDGNGRTALHVALLTGNYAFAETLIEALPDLCHISDIKNISPLHLAAELNQTTILASCLSAGVNPNIIDMNDRTPLHYAAKGGSDAAVSLLLHNSARARVYDNKNFLPHILCPLSRDDLRERLISEENIVSLFARCAFVVNQLENSAEVSIPDFLALPVQAIVTLKEAQEKAFASNAIKVQQMHDDAVKQLEQEQPDFMAELDRRVAEMDADLSKISIK